MSDIVKRLRADADGWERAQHTLTGPFIAALEREAADEIERLSTEVELWKDRCAAERQAHESTAASYNRMMDEP